METVETTKTEALSAEQPVEHSQGEISWQPGNKDDEGPVIVAGETLQQLPEDLYIPPHALRVFLEAFTGPLDLLLYLIKKQNIDILDIPIVKITEQYVQYVDVIQQLDFDLAAEYLVMAAMLAEIKSRMLLPRAVDIEDEEEDPRAELVKRLREYEIFKKAANDIDKLPQLERDIFITRVEPPVLDADFKPQPVVSIENLLMAMSTILQRVEINTAHEIRREPLSMRERMTAVLGKVSTHEFIKFSELFSVEEGRAGVVITFIAILELLRQSMIDMVQASPLAPIHIKAVE